VFLFFGIVIKAMNYTAKEIGLAAIDTTRIYLDWASIPGEEENRSGYLAMARINLDLARSCGFPVGLSCDGDSFDYRK